jgi:hypothetical protein
MAGNYTALLQLADNALNSSPDDTPAVRASPEGWLAAHDLLRSIGETNASRAFSCILKQHAELRPLCPYLQFGRRQRPTPAIHKEHLNYLVDVLLGTRPLGPIPQPLEPPPRRRQLDPPSAAPLLKVVPRPIDLTALPPAPPSSGPRGIAPFGWEWTGSYLRPISNEQRMLRRMRMDRAFSTSFKDVAERLNREGYRTRHGGRWCAIDVEEALDRNEYLRERWEARLAAEAV